MPPPDLTHAQRDYDDLDAQLYPKRIKVQPSTLFTCNKTTRTRLERVLDLLSIYCSFPTYCALVWNRDMSVHP
jgi:hypothetical protein